MSSTGKRWVRGAWWVMTALCWIVAAWSMIRYATADARHFFPEQRQVYLDHLVSVHAHAVYASLALLAGPLQFNENLRRRWPNFHRLTGVAYFVFVFVAGLGAVLLSSVAYGSWSTRLGFAVLAVLWLGTAAMALRHIGRRDIHAHRRWAIRNFSLTFAAVMLRVWVPVLQSPVGLDFGVAYAVAAWLSWLPNLIVVELSLLSGSSGGEFAAKRRRP